MMPSPLAIPLFLLLFVLPAIFFLAPDPLAPKTLPGIPADDELDDLALFRRAILASQGVRVRPEPRPKVAFLFLTNSDLTFAPLWERFFRGHAGLFNVYVHADPTARVAQPGGVFRCRFVRGKATQRSSPTLISAARRLLASALLDDPANAFFALVSQHCVPLHSFRFVYGALVNGGRRSFIEILSGEPGLLDRYVARGEGVMLPEVPLEQFRVGSQFFVLARRHAVLVVGERRLWRKFRMPCLKEREHSCYPEEHYFPTLLGMRDPAGCSGYTLTRVNWTGTVAGHPHTYRPHEVSADLVRRLRHSNGTYSYLFARKFSPDCLHPLLEMADTVIFRD